LLDVSLLLLQLPNGEVTSEQLRYAASIISKYGEDGCADITTRANLQLRGVKLEDADGVIEGLIQHGMGSFQSGMDSVRNLTGSPIAGLDPHELFDTRWACYDSIVCYDYNQQANEALHADAYGVDRPALAIAQGDAACCAC
jgi:ferredoxin-nitrite reductase